MNTEFGAAMRRALLLTRAQDLAGATRAIQAALTGQPADDDGEAASQDITPPRPRERAVSRLIDLKAETVTPLPEHAQSRPEPDAAPGEAISQRRFRLRRPLGEVLRTLRDGGPKIAALDSIPGMKTRDPRQPLRDGAQFLTRSFACEAGGRSYRLYIPASALTQPRGLIVMLHGCKQNPDDFAAGTNMNTVAERHGALVAYPSQPGSANASACWNWFRPTDQRRDAGEPAIIAGLTRQIISEFGLNRRQVFVAGLSAGGAMAAVMGETYPDLYAAVGVHSGLAYGSANDVMSALAAMRGDANVPQPSNRHAGAGAAPSVRVIVFQGSADPVVHPSNAEHIVASAMSRANAGPGLQEKSRSLAGRSYTRTVVADPQGAPLVEYWLVDGAGHAWSGGHPGGSYTDPAGPDASTEMMRFFFAGLPKA
jgi:poly(hydroxyalkanoate) depolymerase family esterase